MIEQITRYQFNNNERSNYNIYFLKKGLFHGEDIYYNEVGKKIAVINWNNGIRKGLTMDNRWFISELNFYF